MCVCEKNAMALMDGIMEKAGHNGNFLGAWSDKFFEKKSKFQAPTNRLMKSHELLVFCNDNRIKKYPII